MLNVLSRIRLPGSWVTICPGLLLLCVLSSGCATANKVVRKADVYQAEVEASLDFSQQALPYLKAALTGESCAEVAELVVYAETFAPYQAASALFIAGISKEEPGDVPVAVDPKTLCTQE